VSHLGLAFERLGLVVLTAKLPVAVYLGHIVGSGVVPLHLFCQLVHHILEGCRYTNGITVN